MNVTHSNLWALGDKSGNPGLMSLASGDDLPFDDDDDDEDEDENEEEGQENSKGKEKGAEHDNWERILGIHAFDTKPAGASTPTKN